jgi:hypothetical protein
MAEKRAAIKIWRVVALFVWLKRRGIKAEAGQYKWLNVPRHK